MIGRTKSSPSNVGAAPGGDKPSEAIPDGNGHVLIARRKQEISLIEFETMVRALVRDVERAYWALEYAYRVLDAVIAGRNGALQTWQQVNAKYLVGDQGGGAKDEAQSRQQYYLFRKTVEQAQSRLCRSERNLRYVMGFAATDGQLIRPADDPTTTKTDFDWKQAINEARRRSPEIRAARWAVNQRELELTAAKTYAASHGDKPKHGLSSAELNLARERTKLKEVELEIAHRLASAARELAASYALTATKLNRRIAAQKEVNAVKTAYEQGTVMLDLLLLAQQRLAEAESEYHRAAVDYVQSIATLHDRKDTLLEYRGVCLAESSDHQE